MNAFVDLTRWFSNGQPVECLLVNKACVVSIVVVGTDTEGYQVGISTTNEVDAWWADPTFTSSKSMALALADEIQHLLT